MPPKRSLSKDQQGPRKKLASAAARMQCRPDVALVSMVRSTRPERIAKTAAEISMKDDYSSSDEEVRSKPSRKKSGRKGQKKKSSLKTIPTVPLEDLPTAPPTDSWLYRLLEEPGWKDRLAPCFNSPQLHALEPWLEKQYQDMQVFPEKQLIFNAFNSTPFHQVKVTILGQDPYHDDGQAHGLSFSVPEGVGIPPSLRNIYKELESDLTDFTRPDHGCLEKWAKEGVLLLNAALTVQAHEPNSHAKSGWWNFTDNILQTISSQRSGTIFILWGGFAHKKEGLIDTSKHTVIKTAHPSPLSFNKFSGCKCFSKANEALEKYGKKPVDWTLK